MAKFQKINELCDRAMARMDELGDEEIQRRRNTPEAKALQAEMSRKFVVASKRAASKLEADRKAAVAAAQSAWNAGDRVVTRRGDTGVVVAIDGANLVIDFDGTVRKFAAAMVRVA